MTLRASYYSEVSDTRETTHTGGTQQHSFCVCWMTLKSYNSWHDNSFNSIFSHKLSDNKFYLHIKNKSQANFTKGEIGQNSNKTMKITFLCFF